MSFRKIFILLELCSISYFVYANPKLCLQTLHALPIAAKNVAADPSILFRLFPGQKLQTPPLVASAETETEAETAEKIVAVEAASVPLPVPSNVQAGVQAPPPAAQAGVAVVNSLSALSPNGGAASDLVNNKLPDVNKKMTDYDRKLAEAFAAAEPDSSGSSGSSVPAAATPPPVKQKTELIQIVRHEATTRFLHLMVRESTLRFHVTNNMTERDLMRVVESLKNACLKASAQDQTCARQTTTVVVDQRFFEDMKLSEVVEWSPSSLPVSGLVWRLTCANGKDECLSSPSRAKAYKLTDARATRNEVTLARGFETRVSKWLVRKGSRVPAWAKPTAIQRAYVTKVTGSQTSLSDAGSL